MDIIEIVRNNLSKKYDKSNWLYQVCIYLLNGCKYLLNSCVIGCFKLIFNKIKDVEIKGKCVLINSPWGSGKTYRFKHNLQPIFKNKGYRCVYISLFGIKTVDELKTKLINNYLNYKYKVFLVLFIPVICVLIFCTYGVDLAIAFNHKIIIKFFTPFYILLFGGILWLIFKFMKLDFIKTILFGLSNKFLGTGIPMNKSEIGELFNPYCNIFIFDDLERISDDCKIKDIMGFIADLKYIHGFNILLIGDEEHLNKENYNLYKEKLVDYEESELTITEDIFNDIVEQIKNKKVKQFVIDGLKPHIDFNGIGEKPITKNLRLILRCIDDIKRLFSNNLLSNENIYWLCNNFEDEINNILDVDKEQIFILDSDIEHIIDVTIKKYIYDSLTEEELKKGHTFNEYTINAINIEDKINNINDKIIKNEFYKNKLQILNRYCIQGHLPNEILDEGLFEKIKNNLMECSEQIECLNENFENYIQAFINLCAVATKEINVYTQHFVDITKSILNKYYTTFYKCIGLSFWTLGVSNIKEISELIYNEINIYRENNVFNFFKEELRDLDNNFINIHDFSGNIIHILQEFISDFSDLIYKNPKILLTIDFESYNHKEIIKKHFLDGLKTYYNQIFENKIDSLEMKQFINDLSAYYSTPRQKIAFDYFLKKIGYK